MAKPAGSVVPSTVDSLKRPVGPLPLWMWGAGIIVAYLGYRYMSTGSIFAGSGEDDGSGSSFFGGGSSGIPSWSSDGSIQAVDPSTVANYTGPEGPEGPAGPKGDTGEPGKDGTSRPAKPTTKPATGKLWWFNVQDWKWQQRKVPAKPNTKLKSGYKWDFRESTWSWVQVKKTNKALGGPFLGAAEVGEVGKEDVYGIGFVKPQYPTLKSPANNGQPTVSGIHVDAPLISGIGMAQELIPEYPEFPNMVGKVPVLTSDRGYGRPFFGGLE